MRLPNVHIDTNHITFQLIQHNKQPTCISQRPPVACYPFIPRPMWIFPGSVHTGAFIQIRTRHVKDMLALPGNGYLRRRHFVGGAGPALSPISTRDTTGYNRNLTQSGTRLSLGWIVRKDIKYQRRRRRRRRSPLMARYNVEYWNYYFCIWYFESEI